MKPEAAKILLLLVALVVCAIVEKVDPAAAAILTLVHFSGLAICGESVRTLAGLKCPDSPCDRAVTAYLLGWCLVPVLAVVAFLSGSIGVHVGIAVAICSVFTFMLRQPVTESPGENIPVSLYMIASLFAIIAVAIPFSSFSGTSIMREFYGDVVQRFGVIYALADEIPPRNPFFAGAPIRYYWLWMLPYAGEYKFVCNDLFAVWKWGQTCTALCFPLGLWFLLKKLLHSSRTAYLAVLFAMVFTSYKVFAHPLLINKAAGLFGIHYPLPAKALSIIDPDFTIGVLQRYSDQILTEDFWYIPQNSYGIIVAIAAMAALTAGRKGIGAIMLSTLVGINAFFVPPAFCAYLVTALALYGWRTASVVLLALCAGCGTFMAICGMLEPGLAVPFVTGLAITGLILSRQLRGEEERALAAGTLQLWAVLMLAAFSCLVMLSPLHNSTALLLGYSPSMLFGIYYLVKLARKQGDTLPFILFLLVFCTLFAFITFLISFQHVAAAPEWLRNDAARLGEEINLFNFYHKSGKMVRVAWAVLGAMGVGVMLPYLEKKAYKAPYLVIIGSTCLFLSAITGIFRPFTYVGHVPVAEDQAAAYLNKQPMKETVLMEDYRYSEINELAPVRVFYYSQWSRGNMGLNTLRGTWADQYLPAGMRHLSLEREQQVKTFFASGDVAGRREFLKQNHIGFILTRRAYDFSGIAVPVVNKPGGYLYDVVN